MISVGYSGDSSAPIVIRLGEEVVIIGLEKARAIAEVLNVLRVTYQNDAQQDTEKELK